MPDLHPLTGLVLTGGGARAAYQVGVLKALAEIRRQATSSKVESVSGHLGHFGRRDQRGGAGLRGRRLRCGGRRPVPGLGELLGRTGLPRRFVRRDPQRRTLADDDVDRLGHRALAPGPAALAARQPAARAAAEAPGQHRPPASGHARGPSARDRDHRVELRIGPARHLLRCGGGHRAVDAVAAPRGARLDLGARTCSRRRRFRSCSRRLRCRSTATSSTAATARCARPHRSRRSSTSAPSGS